MTLFAASGTLGQCLHIKQDSQTGKESLLSTCTPLRGSVHQGMGTLDDLKKSFGHRLYRNTVEYGCNELIKDVVVLSYAIELPRC